MTKLAFEETLISAWQQSLVNNSNAIELEGKFYSVLWTSKRGLRQVDFVYEGQEIRESPQNPDAKSRAQIR